METSKTVITAGTQIDMKAEVSHYTSQEVNGIIEAGDVRFTISSDGVSISNKDTILFNNMEWNIVNIVPTYMGEDSIIYEVHGRR